MGGKSTTSTQSVSIPPEVMARYNAVNTRAEDVAATPFQQYGGNFVAPLTPTQQAGVQNTSYASGQAQPYYGAATGLTLAGAQDVGKLTGNQIGQYMDPFVGSVVQPTLQALQQQQGQERSQLQTNAIKAGAYGGDRAGLERANLARQQGLGTAQAIAPLLSQAYGQAVQTATGQQGVAASDLARRMQAGQQIAGLGTAAQAAGLQGAQAQLQAGQVEQQTQQADLTAQYQQFLQQRGYPFQVAQFLANIAMGTGALSGSTTTTEQPGGLFSDERLKHDAKRVGQTDDGLPIYTFEYNGDNKTHMGVMAQDVEKKHPDVVGEAKASDGHMYKTVDYGKLGAKERAYGGGLDLNSMGGVVSEPGAFARGGYALGGGLISDVEQRSMMANMKQPLGMYQQAGLYGTTPHQTPYGPGLGIRGDAVPVPNLVTAGRLTPQESGIKQALGAYQTVKGIGEMGSGIYDAGERVAVGRPELKNDKGEITQKASSGFFGTKGEYDPNKGWFGSKDAPVQASAHGGLVRGHYATQGGVPGGGGLPYESMTQGYDPLEDIVKQGSQQHYELAKPGQLPKRPEPLKDVMQTGMQMYSAGKMGSAAIDKGKELIGKMGGESMAPATGQIQTDISAMPVARPAGLGAAPVNPDAPAAGAHAVSYEAPGAVNPAGTYTIPGTTQTITPGLGAGSTGSAPAGLVPEIGAAAPETAAIGEGLGTAATATEGVGAGLGAAEGAGALAGGAEALGAAGGAAAGIEELAPLLLMLLKRGGRANAHHYETGGLVPRQEHADGERVIPDYSEEADMPALGATAAEASNQGPDYKTMAINAAKKAGIDPDQFVRLIGGESGFKLIPGDDGSSAGHLQMHVGNVSEKYPNAGLGNAVMRDIYPELDKKLSPSEKVAYLNRPDTQQDQYDYAANHISKNGAGAWTQARVQGLFGLKPMAYASEDKGLGAAKSETSGKATGLASYFPTKKDDTGSEVTDWKKILVPLASSIAGVASAPTRNLGTALAMGLGAGAQSYANLDKQQEDINYRKAETGKLNQETQIQLVDRLIKINQMRQAKGLPPIANFDEYLKRAQNNTLLADQPSEGAKSTGTSNKPTAGTDEAKPTSEIDWSQVIESQNIPKMDADLAELRKLAEFETDPAAKIKITEQMQVISSRINEVKKQPLMLKNGTIISPPSWVAQQRYEQNLPEINKKANEMGSKLQGVDRGMSQLDNIEKALSILQSGAFTGMKNDFAAAMNAAGFPVSDKAMSDVTEAQKVVKDAWNQIFAKAASLPGTIRNLEIQGEKEASPNIDIQPGANKEILVNGKADFAYERKHAKDFNAARIEQGAKFDPLTFETQWREDNPNLHTQLKDQYRKDIALLGDTPVKSNKMLDVAKLQEGHTYILTPDMKNPKTGEMIGVTQPTKVRAVKGEKGNIQLVPVQ